MTRLHQQQVGSEVDAVEGVKCKARLGILDDKNNVWLCCLSEAGHEDNHHFSNVGIATTDDTQFTYVDPRGHFEQLGTIPWKA